MILTAFKFSSLGWTLDSLSLGNANLIVGKNSSGKSKALEALGLVNSVLAQRRNNDVSYNFNAELSFQDEEEGVIYLYLSLKGKSVIKEFLSVNDDVKIERDESKAFIEGEIVSPPADMLLMHVRRDVRKYKYIEKIIKWAEETEIRSFILFPSMIELFENVSKFTPDMCKHLVKMAKSVGFPLEKFGTLKDLFFESDKAVSELDTDSIKIIMVKEENVNKFLPLETLSSGMLRTIVLLILIEQLISLKSPALLAIDDLGEGLDYSRATKVGKLLFDICQKKHIQLIATSNEEFMMNIVDINKWNILVRKGDVVKSITSSLCPEEFENFKFMGLNNFDFFTSDFLERLSSKLTNHKE